MEEYKEIVARLYMKASGENIIELQFDEIVEINLSKNEQSGLKDAFTKMTENALKEKYILKFTKDEKFQNQLILDVAKCYIEELNKELMKLYEESIFKEICEMCKDNQ